MGIVIKTKGLNAPEGALKLYRDALVNEGTLFLHDYSNFGTLRNFDITDWATDLAKESALELGINNESKMRWSPDRVSKPELSEGKGYKMTNLGRVNADPLVFGLDQGFDLGNYLFQNQPHFIMTVWYNKAGETPIGGRLMRLSTGESDNQHMISVNVNDGGAVNPSIAGVVGGGNISQGDAQQYTLEYRGAGQRLRRFMQGSFHSESANVAQSLLEPKGNFIIGNNEVGITRNIGINIYRILIEDLNVSGRTADEAVKDDWDYCHGSGIYTGLPTKRPFIDNL